MVLKRTGLISVQWLSSPWAVYSETVFERCVRKSDQLPTLIYSSRLAMSESADSRESEMAKGQGATIGQAC